MLKAAVSLIFVPQGEIVVAIVQAVTNQTGSETKGQTQQSFSEETAASFSSVLISDLIVFCLISLIYQMIMTFILL